MYISLFFSTWTIIYGFTLDKRQEICMLCFLTFVIICLFVG